MDTDTEQQWQHIFSRLKRNALLLPEVGLPLLVGLRPEDAVERVPPSAPSASELPFPFNIYRREQERFTPQAMMLAQRRSELRKAQKLWAEEQLINTRMTLRKYVDWAANTEINVPWLEAAMAANLLDHSSNSSKSESPGAYQDRLLKDELVAQGFDPSIRPVTKKGIPGPRKRVIDGLKNKYPRVFRDKIADHAWTRHINSFK